MVLEEELESVQEIVQEIVHTLTKRKAAKTRSSPGGSAVDPMQQLAADLALLGICSAGTAPAPAPGAIPTAAPAAHASTSLKPQHQPPHQRVYQVMIQLQQKMQHLHIMMEGQGSRKDKGAVDKLRYDIGYCLGTFVRLFWGPTNLQENPDALPDAFALALQQTNMHTDSSLQVLISGLAGIKMM